jgi:hypothetical protein
MNEKTKALCLKIADWLSKKIDIPGIPEWMETIIFNKLVIWIANKILEYLKKLGNA